MPNKAAPKFTPDNTGRFIAFLPNTIHCQGPDGYPQIIAIEYGEQGYMPIYGDPSIAEDLNFANGVTPEIAEAFLIGSMFGWNCPGAKPARDAIYTYRSTLAEVKQ